MSMSHNCKFKKVIIISLVCIFIFDWNFCIDVHAIPIYDNLNNIISSLEIYPLKSNNSVPDLKGGSEIANRKAYHNPPYKNIVFYIAHTNKKQVALTFDDGPDITFTPEILDILKQNNIRATFFIVGARAKAHPEMIKRIEHDGHAIGNHSWDHPDLDKLSNNDVTSEIQRTDNTLFYLLGYHPTFVRPPYGAADLRVIKSIGLMGCKIIDWSVDTRDWAGTPPAKILLNVRSEIHPGAIILQHCAGGKGENLSNTVTALPQIIKELRSQGYQFVTVPELLGISPRL